MLKAIIFDMDDVLLNSKQFDYPAWKNFFSEYGATLTPTIYKSFLGMKNIEIIEKFVPSIKPDERKSLENEKEIFFLKLLENQGVSMPLGLKDFLVSLRGRVKLGIATSAPKIKVNGILKYLKLDDFFEVIITADQVTKGKPHPELFLKASQKLNTPPCCCLVVEDAPNGVMAAKLAGMKCLAITTTHCKDELEKADIIIDNFKQINLNKVEKLYNKNA